MHSLSKLQSSLIMELVVVLINQFLTPVRSPACGELFVLRASQLTSFSTHMTKQFVQDQPWELTSHKHIEKQLEKYESKLSKTRMVHMSTLTSKVSASDVCGAQKNSFAPAIFVYLLDGLRTSCFLPLTRSKLYKTSRGDCLCFAY